MAALARYSSRLLGALLSVLLIISLLPASALAAMGSDGCEPDDISVFEDAGASGNGDDGSGQGIEQDSMDGAVDPGSLEDDASVVDGVNPLALEDGGASVQSGALDFTVSYSSATTGTPTRFVVNVENGSSNMKYGLTSIWRYEGSGRENVVDPSRVPDYQLDNAFEFTFMTSGRYLLWFHVLDMDALGTANAYAEKRIEVTVTGGPSTEELVDQIVAQCNAAGKTTDYEKALWLHDYIIDHAEYKAKRPGSYNGPGYDYCNAEGVLARGEGTCESYHRAYVMLLNKAGIATGRMEGNGHVWTAVKMDGKWYQVDVTWDDPGYASSNPDLNHLYFGLNDEIMRFAHSDHSKPVAGYVSNSLDDNFYVKDGYAKQVAAPSRSLIQSKLEAGEESFSIDVPNLFATNAYNEIVFRVAAYALSTDDWRVNGKAPRVQVSYADGKMHCRAEFPLVGEVRIAQTEDQKARGAFSVIVSGLPKSVTSVEAPTWSVAGGQDDLVWYPLVFWHGVWTRELPCTGSNRAPGSYIAHAYATSANGVRSFVGGAQANVSLAPVQVTAKVNPDETWFSVFASGGYAQLASSVRFAVWSEAGGQDDLRWYAATKRNGGWGNDIPVSLHKTAGRYQVHIYATQAGHQVFVGATSFNISPLTGGIVSLTQTEDQKARGVFSVTVTGLPKSIASIQAPTWSVAGGQDDIVWYPLVHDGSVWTREVPLVAANRAPGAYIAHAYATASNGVTGYVGGIQATVSILPAQVRASVTPDETWFSVSVTGGGIQQANNVRFAVWSDAGGQDDLIWYPAAKRNGGWGNDIPIKPYRMADRYQVHVYATLGNGQTYIGGAAFQLTEGKHDLSGDAELDGILRKIIAQRGENLRSVFDYVAAYPYSQASLYPTGNWSVPLAKEMYRNGTGNCYRYAALFCWLARALGYDAHVISGHVLTRSSGWAAHGWVEISLNGTTYVCDPDMVASHPTRNFYMTTYGNAPLTYRTW